MVPWTLIPALVSFRKELDTLAPKRDRTSDGAIADGAHVATGTSDHIGDETSARLRGKDADGINEVHAIDVDDDLRKPGWTMGRVVQVVVTRHRKGLDDRLQYVIWNKTIWSASWGWTARAYTGASPHTEHAHLSGKYTTAQENNTWPWGLLDADKPVVKPKPKPVADHTVGSRVLRKGMTGTDVAWLQRWLGLDDTGAFDTKTAAKIAWYQRMRGLAADSIVGPATWSNMLGRTVKL